MASVNGEEQDQEDVPGTKILLTVKDVVGKGPDGNHFWSPKFDRGFIEVRFGKSRKSQVTTSVQKVNDFELKFDEELAVCVPEDHPELVIKLRGGDVKKPGRAVARCGICLGEVIGTTPIDKYFTLFKVSRKGDCERGGYIRVSMNCMKQESKKPGPSIANRELVECRSPTDTDEASLAVLDSGGSRTLCSGDVAMASASWVSIPALLSEALADWRSQCDAPSTTWPQMASGGNAANCNPVKAGLPFTCSPTTSVPISRQHSGHEIDDHMIDCSGNARHEVMIGGDEDLPDGDVLQEALQEGGSLSCRLTRGGSGLTYVGSLRGSVPQDFTLESISPTHSPGAEMPKLNLTLVPQEVKVQQTGGDDGTVDCSQASQQSATSDASTSSQASRQQQAPEPALLVDAGQQQTGDGGQEVDVAESEAASDVCALERQRGMPTWLLVTLSAVGGVAALALKALGPRGNGTDCPTTLDRDHRRESDSKRGY